MSYENWIESRCSSWTIPKTFTIAKDIHNGKMVILFNQYYDQNGFLCAGNFMDYANEDTIINGEMTYIKVPE